MAIFCIPVHDFTIIVQSDFSLLLLLLLTTNKSGYNYYSSLLSLPLHSAITYTTTQSSYTETTPLLIKLFETTTRFCGHFRVSGKTTNTYYLIRSESKIVHEKKSKSFQNITQWLDYNKLCYKDQWVNIESKVQQQMKNVDRNSVNSALQQLNKLIIIITSICLITCNVHNQKLIFHITARRHQNNAHMIILTPHYPLLRNGTVNNPLIRQEANNRKKQTTE